MSIFTRSEWLNGLCGFVNPCDERQHLQKLHDDVENIPTVNIDINEK